MLTRRDALRAGAVLAGSALAGSALAGLPSAVVTAAPVPAAVAQRPEQGDPLSRSRFLPLVGARFRVGPAHRPGRAVRLAAVSTTETGPAAERCFSLRFTDDSSTPLPEGIYRVRHRRIGLVRLFLAPIGARGDRYEAVIHRLA